MSTIRIMLVDDHAVVRAGVRRLLEQDARNNAANRLHAAHAWHT